MRKVAAAAGALLAAAILVSTEAKAVQYLIICDGLTGFFKFQPGDTTCVNPSTGQTIDTVTGKIGQTDTASRVSALEAANAQLRAETQSLQQRFDTDFRNATDGSAIALALASPDLQGAERFGLRFNWGTYLDSNALGVTFAGLIARRGERRLKLTGGVAFTGHNIGGHAGLDFSW
jgi:hypothetical protein